MPLRARVAPTRGEHPIQRRVAVIDLGSNTFRLVAFSYTPHGSFHLTDEIRETVRLSAGAVDGRLHDAAIARGLAAVRMYVAYCVRTGVEEVIVGATSAIRDASNQREVLDRFREAGLDARVLSTEDEAYYGYLGIVNSMPFTDGFFLDVGGGSAQVGRVTSRTLERSMSEPLGAVRMTEAFYTDEPASRSQIKEQRRHVEASLAKYSWIGPDGLPLYGTGGTIRTLAAMAQRASDYPLNDVHAYTLHADAIEKIIDKLGPLAPSQRVKIPGLKTDRGDIILAGAVTVLSVMRALGVETIEVCGEGLREGMFYEHYLAPRRPPIITDVRRNTVENLAGNYGVDRPHAEHVARLALEVFDGTARVGLHEGSRLEREWLWAASLLHDVGVIVDYHDHHKHGFYLVLNGGMPGFTHRELVMIALVIRAHRKSLPSCDWLRPVLEKGDNARFLRLASCLRLAEQLERDRTQQVTSVAVERRDDTVLLRLNGEVDHSVAVWSAAPEAEVFRQAFGARLELVAEHAELARRPDDEGADPSHAAE